MCEFTTSAQSKLRVIRSDVTFGATESSVRVVGKVLLKPKKLLRDPVLAKKLFRAFKLLSWK